MLNILKGLIKALDESAIDQMADTWISNSELYDLGEVVDFDEYFNHSIFAEWFELFRIRKHKFTDVLFQKINEASFSGLIDWDSTTQHFYRTSEDVTEYVPDCCPDKNKNIQIKGELSPQMKAGRFCPHNGADKVPYEECAQCWINPQDSWDPEDDSINFICCNQCGWNIRADKVEYLPPRGYICHGCK